MWNELKEKQQILEMYTLSVSEVAEILGLSSSNIQKIFAGKHVNLKLKSISLEEFEVGEEALKKYEKGMIHYVTLFEGTKPKYRIFPHAINFLLSKVTHLSQKTLENTLESYISLQKQKFTAYKILINKLENIREKKCQNQVDVDVTNENCLK